MFVVDYYAGSRCILWRISANGHGGSCVALDCCGCCVCPHLINSHLVPHSLASSRPHTVPASRPHTRTLTLAYWFTCHISIMGGGSPETASLLTLCTGASVPPCCPMSEPLHGLRVAPFSCHRDILKRR